MIGSIVALALVWKFLPIDKYAAQFRSLTAALPSKGGIAYTHPGKTAMNISSFAFDGGRNIPSAFTCDGMDMSPPLSFADVPTATRSLALIVHDPDAPSGDWLHWTIWNLAPETQGIAEGGIPPGATEGKTDSGKTGYGGPCPPDGIHRYAFDLYALDAMLDLKQGSTRSELETAMRGHIIDQAVLVGTYRRTRI
jgi:hypothetical protein